MKFSCNHHSGNVNDLPIIENESPKSYSKLKTVAGFVIIALIVIFANIGRKSTGDEYKNTIINKFESLKPLCNPGMTFRWPKNTNNEEISYATYKQYDSSQLASDGLDAIFHKSQFYGVCSESGQFVVRQVCPEGSYYSQYNYSDRQRTDVIHCFVI